MSKQKALNNLDYFLSFELETGEYSPCTFVFNVQKVKEVLEATSFHLLPPVYHPFVGIQRLRDLTLPILSLEFILADGKWTKEEAIESRERDWSSHKVIVLDLQGYHIGVLAGQMGRILDPKNTDYLPSPETMGLVKKGFINGMLMQQNQLFYLLDIEAILAELNGGVIEKSTVSPTGITDFKGKKVLVAEDSALFRKKAKALFESFGFEVTLVPDGESALQKFKEHPSYFDLVFTDIEMPIRNGVSFVRELKKLTGGQDIPVIFNSSLSNESLIRDIQNEGLGNYIIKYDEKQILNVLKQVLTSDKVA